MKSFLAWFALVAVAMVAILAAGDPQHAIAATGQFLDSGPMIAGATIGATLPTLVDFAKVLDPSGKVASIAEILSQRNDIVNDMRWVEGNLPDGHLYTMRTGLPDVHFRLLNQGVPPSKSQTAQAKDTTAILEARGQIDVDLAMLNGNSAAWRQKENIAHIEAMGQALATTIFYGNNGTDPEKFSGLATRYSSLSAGNGGNIIDAGGTGSDNSSIWVIRHGAGFHGIVPKGSKAGLQHEDLGIQDAFDSSNNRYRAYIDWYQWKAGIALPDWRDVVRIANIDISTLVAQSGQPNLTRALQKAIHRVAAGNATGATIYMNRTVMQYFEIEQYEAVKNGGGLTYENVDGRPVTLWRGLPVRVVDALLETEARVT